MGGVRAIEDDEPFMEEGDIGTWPFVESEFNTDELPPDKFRAPIDLEVGDIMEPYYELRENNMGVPAWFRVLGRMVKIKKKDFGLKR